jgi:methylmalonyl-CoA mutase, N-terminal domain
VTDEAEDRQAAAAPGGGGDRPPTLGGGADVPPTTVDRWRATTRAKAVSASPERREVFATTSELPIADVYTPETPGPAFDPDAALGLPGEYPFTRGVQATMYRSRFWTMRQYAGFATAAETNERFRYLLSQGQTGLSVAFDLPTQMGYDSDAPEAEGEVGRVGVPIASLADMETLFAGIPLGEVSTSMTINATAPILLALYVAAAEKQGAARSAVSGTTQNDILKEYIARGTWIYPPRQSMRLVTDVFEFASHELPRWNTISISGYHMREAGASAAQELAFTLADGIAYVEAAVSRGLAVDDFAPRLSFFAAWSELFEEVAKFRAARRMWARIMRERFGARNPKSMMCRFHTQTAGSSLTAQSIDNNVVRTTLQALAAVLGGTQSLHTNSRDEALALPTADAARLALRTQQIIAHEAGVTETPDPLGGSWFVESLTDELEAAAQGYLDEIDAMGGTLAAIEGGFQQRQIQESAYRVQREIEREDRIVVGVNRFRDEDGGTRPAIQRIDPEGERRQIESLRRVRAERDAATWQRALDRLADEARGEGNLMPPIIEAVAAYATVGEISDRLRSVWGVHRELITV